MDFFSNLDLDLVLNITLHLSTDDVLRCLVVCKGWSDMLRSKAFDPFWRRACEETGLSDPVQKAQQQKVASFYELFLIARRFGRVIASHTPQVKVLTGSPYPFDSTMNSEHAGQGYFVKHIDMLSVEYKETVIGKYNEETGIISKVGSKPGTHGWLLWSGMSARNVLWATTDGVWFGFEIDTEVFYTLLPHRKLSLGHEAVGCCENCLFVAIVSVESKLRGNVFSLQLLRLDSGMETPVEWKHDIPFAKGLSSFMPKPVSALITPEGGSCSSHLLMLQSGYCVAVYRVEYKSETKEINIPTTTPLAILNPYDDSDIAVMVVNNTSRLTLSRDKKFLGMLTSIAYPYHSGLFIHLWSADTFKRVSSVKVDWSKGEFSDPHLLSLGGLYSAIAVGHSFGCLKIVASRTGKVFKEHTMYARALQSVLPFIFEVTVDYIGVLSDACLNDLSPVRVKMLFRDSRGRDRANMRMLQFVPPRGAQNDATTAVTKARDSAGNDSDT